MVEGISINFALFIKLILRGFGAGLDTVLRNVCRRRI
jgi:hypothetical protein